MDREPGLLEHDSGVGEVRFEWREEGIALRGLVDDGEEQFSAGGEQEAIDLRATTDPGLAWIVGKPGVQVGEIRGEVNPGDAAAGTGEDDRLAPG